MTDAADGKLLDCPFCGSPAEWEYGHDGNGRVECSKCRAQSPVSDRDDAEARWNNRAAAPLKEYAPARLLYWRAPSHMPAPHGGVAARTFAEFPKGSGEGDGYWAEGPLLYNKTL